MAADHRVTPRASRDVAVDAVAVLTKEVAALRAELRDLQAAEAGPSTSSRTRGLARRLRSRWKRPA